MAHRVCPWWMGYLLANPVRRWMQDPGEIVGPFVSNGMIVLEPGPGMGFFTLELARRVGSSGRVIAVDVQPQMIQGLMQRAKKAGLDQRIDGRLVKGGSMGVDDCAGNVDFALIFATLHEVPKPDAFLAEVRKALKPGAKALFAEPAGHVKAREFDESLALARNAGLVPEPGPEIRRSRTALLVAH